MDFDKIQESRSDDKEELHFFYNREERLKNAPQIVQDYYSGKFKPAKGFFRIMFATKGNRFLFVALVLFVAFIWGYSFLSNRNSLLIDDVNCEIKAFSYGEEIFSSLELKESKKENLSSKTVEVVFSAIDNTGSVSQVSDAFVETYSGSQLFVRTKFKDYDIIKIVAKISVGEESQELIAIVER